MIYINITFIIFGMIDKKIALVHDHLFQMGGAERVLLEFTKIYPESPIFTLIYDKKRDYFFCNSKIITSFIQKFPFSTRIFKWFLPVMPIAWEKLDLRGYDIILSSVSALAKGIRKQGGTKHICYCHTPTRYLWSEKNEYVAGLRIPKILKKILLHELENIKKWDFKASQDVDYFIANSNFIAERIKKYYNRESDVIYPPVCVNNFYSSEIRDDYYIIVSRLRPYKKVELAIKAFNQLKLPLKVVGGGEYLGIYRKMSNSNIEFLGELSDDEKAKYLSRAKAFINPQEEDFGISAVEAMASGCPVIAYDIGGVKETVIEGETGVFFEEQNWASLVDAILRFEKMTFDRNHIKEYAQKFSDVRFRREIKEYIDSRA